MSEQRDEGLLLRRIPYGDASFVCHFLTSEHGRIALMARGVRRAKSPFRATLAPLHALNLRWRPGRRGMGTLLECGRGDMLVPLDRALAGMELLALASRLFIEGDPHGFAETRRALARLTAVPAAGCLHVACWSLLGEAGWVGGFDACWQCGTAFGSGAEARWTADARLVCAACGSGRRLAPDEVARLDGWMQGAALAGAPDVLPSWAAMMRDVLRRHGVRHRIAFSSAV
ncbi:MAG: recombination protein O N-terminal domain-containing protein [Mariprofundaceae bacterium]